MNFAVLNAEGAEESQRTQRSQEILWMFLCDLCGTFASSAFGLPAFGFEVGRLT